MAVPVLLRIADLVSVSQAVSSEIETVRRTRRVTAVAARLRNDLSNRCLRQIIITVNAYHSSKIELRDCATTVTSKFRFLN